MQPNYKVPTLAELHQDNDTAYATDQLKKLLNIEPIAEWVKKHKQTNIEYLPIDKHEFLLDRIFGQWKVEVIEVKVICNAIQVTVRVHYFNPTVKKPLIHNGFVVYDKDGGIVYQVGEWSFTDGVGAMPIQLKAGSAPGDLSNVNHNAIQMAVPAAKSYAVKDACEHLGKLFGRDLTRKNTIPYVPAFTEDPYNSEGNQAQTGTGQAPPPPPPLPQHLQPEYPDQRPWPPVATQNQAAVNSTVDNAYNQMAGRAIRPTAKGQGPWPPVTAQDQVYGPPVNAQEQPPVIPQVTAPPAFNANFFAAPALGDNQQPANNFNQPIQF